MTLINFKELTARVKTVMEDLKEIQDTMKEKEWFSRALQLCDSALHQVSQMDIELTRCNRQFAEVKELMK